MRTEKNDIKHYYTKLHADGFRYTNKFSGFDSACAHFSTRGKVGTLAFHAAQQEGIEFTGNQEVSHGWVDYTVGKTYVKTGEKPVTAMSPAWEYRTPTTMNTPVYEVIEVEETP